MTDKHSLVITGITSMTGTDHSNVVNPKVTINALNGHEHDGHFHTHNGLDHFHSHRNIIGFDEHGIPEVILKADHSTGDPVEDAQAFVKDYNKAVNEYRKTFPSKQDVIDNTPDPAVREMILRAEQIGFDTAFDRFDKQKPQCSFGLAGICCKICNMGPCRITPKASKGVCGADSDLIVARNLLRSGAAGAAQHGMHAREVILNLKWAAEGKLDIPIIGKQKVIAVAKAFGIETENRDVKEIASELADTLLEDLSRAVPDEYKTIRALAPKERQETWKDLDIIPISAYHEVFEAYHKSGCGIDGDWRSIMQQFLRCGLAFTFTGVVATNIATDCLFGVGDRVTSMVNLGALKKGYVNIAVHGHLPLLVSEIVKSGQSEQMLALAKEKGALGIRFYGICCSGLAAMYRYAGVIPLSNAVSAELVLGTGALDLWVADVQDVYPAIKVQQQLVRQIVNIAADLRHLGEEGIALLRQKNVAHHHAVERAVQPFQEHIQRELPVGELFGRIDAGSLNAAVQAGLHPGCHSQVFRMAFEKIHLLLQLVIVDPIVVAREIHQILAFAERAHPEHIGRETNILFVHIQVNEVVLLHIAADDRDRPVLGAVVGDHDLIGEIHLLAQNAVQRLGDIFFMEVGRHIDADERSFAHGITSQALSGRREYHRRVPDIARSMSPGHSALREPGSFAVRNAPLG